MNFGIILTDRFFNREAPDDFKIFWEVVPTFIGYRVNFVGGSAKSMFHFEIDDLINQMDKYVNEIHYDIVNNPYSIFFGEYIDFEEFPIKILVTKPNVGFRFLDEWNTMSKIEFYKLCLKMTDIALQAVDKYSLVEKGMVNEDWFKAIEVLIPKIKVKIKESIDLYGIEFP